MNKIQKFTLAATLAFAAASPVFAQSGPGGGVGTGDGSGGAAGTSEGGGGTTGWLANSPSISTGRLTATRILPADGSNTDASTTATALAAMPMPSSATMGASAAPSGERDMNIRTK